MKRPIDRTILALAAVLASAPALAQDYPKGLFENSPVVPSGPPGAAAPSGPDADSPPGDANGDWTDDDYCAGVQSRTFHSLAEVQRAHARCDRARGGEPYPPPGDEPEQ